MTRSVRRLAACLALAALGWSAVAPLASQANAAGKPVPLMVCGPGGIQEIHVPGEAPAQPAHAAREHCALCLAVAELIEPPRPPVIFLATPDGLARVAGVTKVHRQRLHAHPPPSRAPPAAIAA